MLQHDAIELHMSKYTYPPVNILCVDVENPSFVKHVRAGKPTDFHTVLFV